MPYFIPALAVAGGFWGIKKILSQDDSADQKVAQVIKKIPQNLRKIFLELSFTVKISMNCNSPSIKKYKIQTIGKKVKNILDTPARHTKNLSSSVNIVDFLRTKNELSNRLRCVN
ncbi:hypothetical protein LWC08_03855 [Desulfobaculum bizertense]|uniref:hypothetical protein n=1 Tax=Desulfobaculum bizertense TaxID=376490 RepID=UPI001F47B3B9|nr:hypothetical protein [Desulfobaculum bizertense]UIJ38713.1 hypothetical protein LWC08_03855 [Desulfobaculum bizertense]